MTNKEKYREFYNSHSDICIFSAPWWLDTICGKDNWDVIFAEKNGQIHAVFPYFIKKEFFWGKQICMPVLTQKMGPYILYEKNLTSHTKIISYEHECYNQIIEQLPKFDYFEVNFNQAFKNWLPFFWNGFKQTSRYSYQIHGIKDYESVKKGYAKSKKYEIPKAQKILTFKYDLPADEFYDYFSEVVKDRGDKPGYTRAVFKAVYNSIYAHNAGRCFYCEDKEGNIHAINITVWDNTTAYYLIAMRKKEFNTSGGTEFLVDETIKYVSQYVDTFDFEGSMIKGVEASYRNYGGEQTEYYNISKENRLIIPILRDCRNILKRIIKGRR